MLTPRQEEVLRWIIQLYRQSGEPIGSKTLLQESQLQVSPATIRNDMAALEQAGFLTKAHSSSGRIPSGDGYRFCVQQIIDHPERIKLAPEDAQAFEEILQAKNYDAYKLTQLSADILVSLTGYTAIVFGQSQDVHHFDEMRLVLTDERQLITLLVTDQGHIENELFQVPALLSREDIQRMMTLINSELKGLTLQDAYQRMKLSIPLQTQKAIGYQFDFSPLIEKAIFHLKTHTYWVSGKSNIFDLIDRRMEPDAMKLLFNLVDGSRDMLEVLENQDTGVHVLFGDEYAPEQLDHINLVTGTFNTSSDKMTVGLLGPVMMPYERIIATMTTLVDKLAKI